MRWLAASDRVPWLVLAWFMAQAIALSLLRSGTSYDGAEQLLYTQYLDWGYGRSQPPLFTWVLIAVQQVLGVSQLAENVLKFGLLAAGFVAVWRLALGLGYDRVVAAAAMVSVFAIVEIGFESQRNYTHSVLLFALTGWIGVVYLSLLRAGGDSGALRYAALGLLLGAAMLSKYNAALLIVALVAADLVLREARVFTRRRSVWIWAVAIAVMLPHGIWAVSNAGQVFALSGGFVEAERGGVAAVARAAGLYGMATLGLFLPLAVIAAVAMWWRAPGGDASGTLARAVIWRWAIVIWGIGGVVALLGPATEVRMRWLIPVAVPLVPLLIGAVLVRAPRGAGFVLGAGVLLGVILTAAQWGESLWVNARTDYDYAALAEALAGEDLPMDIVMIHYPEFANLRLYGTRSVIAPPLPDPGRISGDAATVLWDLGQPGHAAAAIAFARDLGLCATEGEVNLSMARRIGDGAMEVGAVAVSRAACGTTLE